MAGHAAERHQRERRQQFLRFISFPKLARLIVATPSLRLLQVDECFKPFCNSACPHTMRAVTKPRMEYEHQHSYWAIMHCCTVAHKLPAREVGYHSV